MFMGLTRKVVLAACVGLAIILGAAIFAMREVVVLRATTDDLATATVRQIWLLEDFNVAVMRSLGEARTYVLSQDPEELDQAQAALAVAATAFTALDIAVAEPQNLALPEEQPYIALYTNLKSVFADLQKTIGVLEAADAGSQEEIAEKLEALEEDFERFDAQFTEVLTAETDEVATRVSEEANTIFMNILGMLLVVFLLTIAAVVVLRRAIIQPIETLSEATNAIIAGKLDHTITRTSADELGVLQANFNAMTARIRQETTNLERQVAVANDARAQAERSQTELAAQLVTIEEQRSVIRGMSVPILPVTAKTMVVPLVGELDADRLQLLQEQALQAIEKSQARQLILDITAVPVVDTHVAQGLVQVVNASRLLGTTVVLVGIRPEVAQSLVSLGVDLQGIKAYGTLQSGLLAV
jgi:rsbT co-antagonist protein RsbR